MNLFVVRLALHAYCVTFGLSRGPWEEGDNMAVCGIDNTVVLAKG